MAARVPGGATGILYDRLTRFDNSSPDRALQFLVNNTRSGATVTIFQKTPSGDFLRVATNVQAASGSRAIGTYIPVTNPDGRDRNIRQTAWGFDPNRDRGTRVRVQ